METILLTDPDIEPTDEVLEKEVGELFPLLKGFLDTITSEEYKFSPEWRFYKDGGAWLCKICHKKTTVVWLSLFPSSFKLAFYFTEKTGAGIRGLNIDDGLKRSYEINEPSGRLNPLVVEVSDEDQLSDAFTLIRFKSELI